MDHRRVLGGEKGVPLYTRAKLPQPMRFLQDRPGTGSASEGLGRQGRDMQPKLCLLACWAKDGVLCPQGCWGRGS